MARGSNLLGEGFSASRSPQSSQSPPAARANSEVPRLGTVTVTVHAVRRLGQGCEQARVCVDIRSMFEEFDLNKNGRIERSCLFLWPDPWRRGSDVFGVSWQERSGGDHTAYGRAVAVLPPGRS